MQFLHRKFVIAVLLLALVCVPMPAFAALDTRTTIIDETATELQCYSDDTGVYMTASDLAVVFSNEYAYNTDNNTVTYTLGKTFFSKKDAGFTVDSTVATVNGKEVILTTAPVQYEDMILIPVEAISAVWNASYGYNSETLYLRTDGGELIVPELPKVFVEKRTVFIDEKPALIRYIRIPAESQLKADVALAQNSIGATEELSSMAERSSAKAAINGGFFQSFDDTKVQEPYGVLIKNGKLIHSDNTGSTIGFSKDGEIKLGVIRTAITANIDDTAYSVTLMNHSPAADSNSIALFTSTYGETIQTTGTSIIVQNGTVSAISTGKTATIPKDGFVLLFTGNKANMVETIQKGDAVSYAVSYVNTAHAKVDWSDVQTAIGAGPILLYNGNIVLNPAKEGFTDETSFQIAVARSAIGITEDGTILLIGGVKCTAAQLADIMLKLGAVNAIAMESGSSSGLYISTEDAVATSAKAMSNALIFK